jgi:hypothetical protein
MRIQKIGPILEDIPTITYYQKKSAPDQNLEVTSSDQHPGVIKWRQLKSKVYSYAHGVLQCTYDTQYISGTTNSEGKTFPEMTELDPYMHVSILNSGSFCWTNQIENPEVVRINHCNIGGYGEFIQLRYSPQNHKTSIEDICALANVLIVKGCLPILTPLQEDIYLRLHCEGTL